ncbi:AEC family transporter [Epibacterium sp. MM17-32]|uniref:AEC family transporter n=1 Tax=Epibacterium sp. MM17-32 TaxID=2917734 RepID=UPI001EF52E92|nr:AEC family transporter [Epibacterium sp. MM17-32]MCG7629160.1 AEC family transporter [Epibacterium sp. MM17-32]
MIFNLINVVLPVFVVVGVGYGLTLRGVFQQSQIDGLMKFAQGVAIPFLLFRAMAGIDLGSGFDPRLLVSFYTGAGTCFFAGFLGARVLFKREWEDCVAIGFCCLFSNSVLLGLPITERAFGPDALVGNYAIIAFHSPFCYALGITAMEIIRNRGQGGVRTVTSVLNAIFHNNLILAILAGFAFNLAGITLWEPVDDALALVASAGLPTALFALGGIMVQYRPEGDLRTIAMVCGISLLLHPAIVFGLGSALDVRQDLFRSGVLNAAMAPGVNGYIFANMYGRAKRVAASSVLIATASCVVTVLLWLTLLS